MGLLHQPVLRIVHHRSEASALIVWDIHLEVSHCNTSYTAIGRKPPPFFSTARREAPHWCRMTSKGTRLELIKLLTFVSACGAEAPCIIRKETKDWSVQMWGPEVWRPRSWTSWKWPQGVEDSRLSNCNGRGPGWIQGARVFWVL